VKKESNRLPIETFDHRVERGAKRPEDVEIKTAQKVSLSVGLLLKLYSHAENSLYK
jgi:hypothetical protein